MESMSLEIFTLLLLLFLVPSNQIDIKTSSIEWSKPLLSNFVPVVYDFNFQFGKTNAYPYAYCLGNNCGITVDFFKSNASTTTNLMCSTIFSNDVNTKNIFFKSILGNRVAFYYYVFDSKLNGYYEYSRIVNMTDCTFHKSRVFLSSDSFKDFKKNTNAMIGALTQIVMYDDGSYDVFLLDKEACGGARCKFEYNSRGEVVKERVPYFAEQFLYDYIDIFPSQVNSSTGDYFALITNYTHDLGIVLLYSSLENRKVKLVQASGDGKVRDLLDLGDDPTFSVDNSHGVFGICWSNASRNDDESRVNCAQYDSKNASKIFDVNFPVAGYANNIKVHNVPGGGMFFVHSVCEKNRFCKERDKMYLRYLRPDGASGENQVQLKDLNCGQLCSRKDLYVADAEGDDICVNSICDCVFTGVRLTRNCLTKKDVLGLD